MNLHPAWRTALPALAVALVVLMLLQGSTIAAMASIWWHFETYTHGLLVGPIALYMVWVRWPELACLQPRVAPWGVAVLAVLSLTWLVADAAEVAVVRHFAVVLSIPAVVYTLLGPQVTWAMAFPLGFLLFAVPVGEALIPPLQQVTAWFTVEGLRLTGIPVWWEGLYLSIPAGHFEVAEACSGLRYLMASVTLGVLYAYLTYRSPWRRLAFVVLSMVMPIVANGIRAYGIVMIAHLSEMKYATGVDHLIYGWLFFGLVVLLMFWIGSFWREPEANLAAAAGSGEQAGGDDPSHAVSPVPADIQTLSYGLWVLAVILATAVGPLLAWPMQRDIDVRLPMPALTAPMAMAPWQGPEVDTDDWEPRFSGADVVLRSRYRLEGRNVHLYIAYYREQRPEAKLVSSQNSLYDRRIWRPTGEHASSAWLPQATHLTDGQRRRLVWSGYWEGGRVVRSPYAAKLWEAWDRLSGARRGSALVAVAADYDQHPDEAQAVLQRFMAAMQAGIAATLMRAGGEQQP